MGALSSVSANRFQEILRDLGTDFQVVEFMESTRTAQEAADRLKCSIGQIVKSLVFKANMSNRGILVLTSGSNRVDEKKISSYVGEIVNRAEPDFVRSVTGFAIGGVPPVGHPEALETYIDGDLLQYDKLWAAAGAPNAVFSLSPTDLQRITHGKTVSVKKE